MLPSAMSLARATNYECDSGIVAHAQQILCHVVLDTML